MAYGGNETTSKKIFQALRKNPIPTWSTIPKNKNKY